MQDLNSACPIQEACAISCRFCRVPVRQHALGHTDHTDQEYTLPWKIYRRSCAVGVGGLSDACHVRLFIGVGRVGTNERVLGLFVSGRHG